MNCVNFQATLLSVSGVCLLCVTMTVLVSMSLISVVFQQEMAAILEVSVVRFKRVFDIRWLSLGNCIAALNYEPLMVVLEESAAGGDATAIGKSVVWHRNSKRVAEKYDCMPADEQSYLPSVHLSMVMFVQLSRIHFVHLIHFVGDVLTETNSLNCHFQERGVNFSSIRYAVCRLFPYLQPYTFDEMWIIM